MLTSDQFLIFVRNLVFARNDIKGISSCRINSIPVCGMHILIHVLGLRDNKSLFSSPEPKAPGELIV